MARYLHRPLGEDVKDRLKALDHVQTLLGSDLIHADTLRAIMKKREISGSGSKSDLVSKIGQLVVDDDDLALELVRAYCLQSKRWLAVLVGEPKARPTARSGADFARGHGPAGAEACYGPISAGGSNYYIITKSVPQTFVESGNIIVKYLRWSCIAQVERSYVAFHWDNTTYRDPKEGDSHSRPESQFPYWYELARAHKTMSGMLKAELSFPPLMDIVLNRMWEAYEWVEGYEWAHEKIRADARGVALAASGRAASDVEIDASGIVGLTEVLAGAVAKDLGIADEETLHKVQRRILHTLIREWNPKSYQFQLHKQEGSDEQVGLPFRGHIYFGAGVFQAGGNDRSGPDGIPHLKCYAAFGGSNQALAFLLEYLES